MQIRRLLGLVVTSVSGALCAASCAQPEDVQGPTTTPEDDTGSLMSELTGDEAEAVSEAQEALSFLKIVRCTGDELGADCERKCDAAGVWCPSLYAHPYKRDAGNGELFQCRDVLGARSCWYYYESNQDKCIRVTGAGRVLTLCSYEGERP
jgi:hypothetical protein